MRIEFRNTQDNHLKETFQTKQGSNNTIQLYQGIFATIWHHSYNKNTLPSYYKYCLKNPSEKAHHSADALTPPHSPSRMVNVTHCDKTGIQTPQEVT